MHTSPFAQNPLPRVGGGGGGQGTKARVCRSMPLLNIMQNWSGSMPRQTTTRCGPECAKLNHTVPQWASECKPIYSTVPHWHVLWVHVAPRSQVRAKSITRVPRRYTSVHFPQNHLNAHEANHSAN